MSPGPGSFPNSNAPNPKRRNQKGTRAGVSVVAPAPAGSLPDWPRLLACQRDPCQPRRPSHHLSTTATSSASPQSPHRAGPSPVAKHPSATVCIAAQQYDAAHETGQPSQAMRWMKSLGPAGFAVRNVSSSHGSLLCPHTIAAGRSSSSSRTVLITAAAAPFSTSCPALLAATRYPPRPKPPPEHEFTEVYLKGTGPGGQKIVCPHIVSIFVASWPSLFLPRNQLPGYPALIHLSCKNRTKQTLPSSSSTSPPG